MHLSSSLLESSQLISHLINLLLCLVKMEFASNCYTLKIYTVVIGSEWSTVFVLQAFPIKNNIYNTRYLPNNMKLSIAWKSDFSVVWQWIRKNLDGKSSEIDKSSLENCKQRFYCIQETKFSLALCFLCSESSLKQCKSIFCLISNYLHIGKDQNNL